jgi:hypothetical protein
VGGAQAHERFVQPGGELTGQQAQFLIEGGNARPHRPGRPRRRAPW